MVATHPVQFLAREDFKAHEARVCIAEGYTLADPRRPRRYTEQQYFKTQAEMEQLFADVPIALANSIALTPGSLVMDIEGDTLFVHWLDVQTTDPDEATRIIAGPFEKHLEKVFG